MLYVIANNIRSLYNVGSLFRLADGVGVDKLYLCGITGAPFEDLKHDRQRRQIAKTALEGLNSVAWEYCQDAVQLATQLKADGIQIAALELTDTSLDYLQAKYHSSICLILGHETDGVDNELLQLADLTISLPMYGQGKSLNVITAASVALYHIKHQLNS
jgi:tRNA G18 (ribose-2'-O)-methylase SpoU